MQRFRRDVASNYDLLDKYLSSDVSIEALVEAARGDGYEFTIEEVNAQIALELEESFPSRPKTVVVAIDENGDRIRELTDEEIDLVGGMGPTYTFTNTITFTQTTVYTVAYVAAAVGILALALAFVAVFGASSP